MSNAIGSHLEPRVARLESGLETLTRNVSDMAVAIRDNNQKIDTLVVSVTKAQAPKATEWGILISAIGLIFVLGAAVLVPINTAINDNKQTIEKYHNSMVEHLKMDNHPVGEAKIQALVKDMDQIKLELVRQDVEWDTKIQKETRLMAELITAKLVTMDQRLQMEMVLRAEVVLANQKVQDAMLKSHEKKDEAESKLAASELKKMADNEHAELMLWRQKAMGLSSPSEVVPLIKREGIK